MYTTRRKRQKHLTDCAIHAGQSGVPAVKAVYLALPASCSTEEAYTQRRQN
jgi:hypothetical protein